jgi:hypothetical protein
MIDQPLSLVGFRSAGGTGSICRERFEGSVQTPLLDQPAPADDFDEFLGTQRGHNCAGENRQWDRIVALLKSDHRFICKFLERHQAIRESVRFEPPESGGIAGMYLKELGSRYPAIHNIMQAKKLPVFSAANVIPL